MKMTLLIVIIIIIGLAGIIGNQYSSLQRMNQMQKTLEEIRDTLREKKGQS
ncbi:hypothetical protein [Cohnella sp. WQ 127256]|uniref:hypothetical protein n=1 Tax=Cohnella sp. WQ 127256 TaxID=2938790 RepID=UPI002117553B|nr:hypothetical protein [Cohnella sp. WQ 127256]